ncbi:hypothetical protein K2173_013172 [Erythroxylum novogranatense]|uniref:Uncharacterized protein n=1 Tax=Erythroxylum novogranatense TaxID=1862640 RepID=A0AAV8TGS8_9ROSI|nr:hypothetical protein K2173_013172 [Erythroxylum novogranatense]
MSGGSGRGVCGGGMGTPGGVGGVGGGGLSGPGIGNSGMSGSGGGVSISGGFVSISGGLGKSGTSGGGCTESGGGDVLIEIELNLESGICTACFIRPRVQPVVEARRALALERLELAVRDKKTQKMRERKDCYFHAPLFFLSEGEPKLRAF